MQNHSVIFIAGSEHFVGEAIQRKLSCLGFLNSSNALSAQVNLRDSRAVERFFRDHRPEYVFLLGGQSGGIRANLQYPAELITDNLMIQGNVLESAYRYGVEKVLFLASSCSYPRECPQPMKPEDLMSGKLEPSSEPYATAKLTGMSMVRAYRTQYGANYIAGIPGDTFGPGDHFVPEWSHVVAGLMMRMEEARIQENPCFEVWGSGNQSRQFIFIDDLAEACIFLMQNYHEDTPINIGGTDCVTIRDLAFQLKDVVGYQGEIWFNSDKPDGASTKELDTTRLSELGWSSTTKFCDGLKETYAWYKENRKPKYGGSEPQEVLVSAGYRS